jgi:hypothetical protein
VSVETLEPDVEEREADGPDDNREPVLDDAVRGDIPGGAEAAPVLWVVLTPAGIGRPRQARGPFADPTDARAYGRELGGGYEVVEFGFATVPAAASGRRALDALAATVRRQVDRQRDEAVAAASDASGQPFNPAAFSRS